MEYDYVFVPSLKSKERICLRITDGPYEGLVYSYGNVQVNEDEENEEATLSFDYDVEAYPYDESLVENLDEDKQLKTMLGDILVEMIRDRIEQEQQDSE